MSAIECYRLARDLLVAAHGTDDEFVAYLFYVAALHGLQSRTKEIDS